MAPSGDPMTSPSAGPSSRADRSTPLGVDEMLAELPSVVSRLRAAVGTVIQGKDEVVDASLAVFLAGGHLLLEDVPGVGKTTLAKTLARVVDTPMRRIQFTPDLLPSDITGISIYDQQERRFEFRPGAIFANIVVCDEINRASPKTQSAVLESMEELQVTVDGHTYPLHRPFLVVATQNPLEMEGTYPLPEAQRDRFMARLSMGYPSETSELDMLEQHGGADPLTRLQPITDTAWVARAVEAVSTVHASEALRRYIVELVAASRRTPALRLGASPRASLHLLRISRARAAMAGRDHVLPEDVRSLVRPVLHHRVLLSGESRLARLAVDDVIDDLVAAVAVPSRSTRSAIGV